MRTRPTRNAAAHGKQGLSALRVPFIHSQSLLSTLCSSERASSLALPLNSLLDFYDKQQEQCKSVTLLPLPSNGCNNGAGGGGNYGGGSNSSSSSIVRRHSSHYYPMLEDKQKPTANDLLVSKARGTFWRQVNSTWEVLQE